MKNVEDLYNVTQVMKDTTLFCFFIDSDPLSFNKAIIGEKWIKAMDEEIHAIEKNDTWKLTNLLESKKVIGLMIHFPGLEVTQKEEGNFVS